MESRPFIDTHVACWLYEGKLEKFSKSALHMIEKNALYLSPFCILEMDYLHEIRRIQKTGKAVLNQLQASLSIHLKNDEVEPLIEKSSEIRWTCDVFDRLITAHAILNRSDLITKDRKILHHYKQAVW